MRIFLTGASGNLGRELAIRLARPGTRISLWGRDKARLAAVAETCRNAGAEAEWRAIDISDIDAAVAALEREDAADPFDWALLVAGQGDTRPAGRIVEDPAQVARLAIANFAAPAALAAAIAERMARRGHGRIGLVGSAAASHSLPFAASYSGSKAGLARFADALRVAVKNYGVTVTLLAPGFFAAAAVKPTAGRPGEIPAGVVAAQVIAAVTQGRAVMITPPFFAMLGMFSRLLPQRLRDRLLLSITPP